MENIPHEIWEKILGYVLICDLCSFVQVSTDFYNIGTYPKLWIKTNIRKSKIKAEGAKSLQNIPRFSKLNSLDLSDSKLSKEGVEDLLHYISENPNLEQVNLRDADLSQAPKALLAKAVTSLKKVNLMHTNLSTEQCHQIFLEMEDTNTRLSEINLSANNLSEVSAPYMSGALAKLDKIELVYTNLQTAHCTCLFLSIISSDKSLPSALSTLSFDKSSHSQSYFSKPSFPSKSISLGSVPLLHVPSDLLSSLVPHLNFLDLSWTALTKVQSISLLTEAANFPSLKTIILENVDLSEVPAQLFTESLKGLRRADLTNTMLTTIQIESVLTAAKASPTLLDLTLHGLDLSHVVPLLLAEAVSHLEKADLAWTQLTPSHFPPLLTHITSSKTLTTINLQQCTNLATVSHELLPPAFQRLTKLQLSSTSISFLHISSILTSIPGSSLQHLILYNLDLSRICPTLLSTSIALLHHIDLNSTNLTTAQCSSTFAQISLPSSRLQSIHLTYVSLSSVPADILAAGVSNLVTADLSYTALTTDQCGEILKKCVRSRRLKQLAVGHNRIKLAEIPKDLLKECRQKFTLTVARN